MSPTDRPWTGTERPKIVLSVPSGAIRTRTVRGSKMRRRSHPDPTLDLLRWLELRSACSYCGSKSMQPCYSIQRGTNEAGLVPYPGFHKARTRTAWSMWRKFVDQIELQKCDACGFVIGHSHALKAHVCGEEYKRDGKIDGPPLPQTDFPDRDPRVAAAVFTLGMLRSAVSPGPAADLVEQLVGILELEDLPAEPGAPPDPNK